VIQFLSALEIKRLIINRYINLSVHFNVTFLALLIEYSGAEERSQYYQHFPKRAKSTFSYPLQMLVIFIGIFIAEIYDINTQHTIA